MQRQTKFDDRRLAGAVVRFPHGTDFGKHRPADFRFPVKVCLFINMFLVHVIDQIIVKVENYRDCVEDEVLKGITLSVKWEQDRNGHKEVACRAVIKPKVLLAQLEKYCAE